ncbi:diaminopimelate epimerase [Campylobacter sp. MIT 21-1685]|uniref:diaminopimelate epimerase n=1 Tax=unclassified Campylobacter TaxID=2593542 RepID=UPI00224AF3E4|nr:MULTISPECIES: diaminopimelate epimerase [unclassified Campylobacter]MCX2683770.1 diaminopimelate epimerase [Campylobacter sp. MIT 21-1684]MCX2752055.1 diaminopimelate epimerase [Campylobacter sp. MIT 21-1682]MCX2808247.1 diaminopimelate epimerase [Campylobacter sp. MIT 21-1685]
MKFYKYYVNGNDFILFTAEHKENRSELARKLCNRYEGIGADGFIVLLPHHQYDFEWEFYNCDGSTPLMCGNGSRAAAHFAHHYKGIQAQMNFLTGAGVIKAKVQNDEVELSLGKATKVKNNFEKEGKIWQFCDTGVPHLVHFCENIDDFDTELCQRLRKEFNANVNFATVLKKDCIKVRTYERGVENETLACGTGMGACFYLASLNQLIDKKAFVLPKSNEKVLFRLENEEIFFKGRVRCCFEAYYHFS